MRIKPDDKKIRSFTTEYWKRGRRLLYQNSRKVVDLIGNVPIDEVKGRAENILNSPELKDYLIDIWSTTGSWFARDMNEQLMTRVSKETDLWEEAYIRYMETRVAAKAMSIARTEATLINSVIDIIIQEGHREGYSIDRLTATIQRELDKRLKVIHDWEAERIARTEVIGASNKGSFDGALSTGLDIRKQWLTSGLKGIRDSHLAYEKVGFKPMNYEYIFAGLPLKHPGDPNGSPEDIINCRCTIIYET